MGTEADLSVETSHLGAQGATGGAMATKRDFDRINQSTDLPNCSKRVPNDNGTHGLNPLSFPFAPE